MMASPKTGSVPSVSFRDGNNSGIVGFEKTKPWCEVDARNMQPSVIQLARDKMSAEL